MDTLQNMRMFARVAESGSFTAAARSLNLSTGAISRAVSELETHVRASLLHRSTRRLSLTTVGEQYLQCCRQILTDIHNAEDEASGAHARPTGTFRMHCFPSIGQRYMLQAISAYRMQYPSVAINLTLSENPPDLFGGTSDLTIVSALSLPDSKLISRYLGSTYSILCASPGYLGQHGTPENPEDLAHHDCVMLNTPGVSEREWPIEGPDGKELLLVKGQIQVNIPESVVGAIRENMGIGPVPMHFAVEGLLDGSLVRVLPRYTLQATNFYALFTSRKFLDAKTRTWLDLLTIHLPKLIMQDEAALAHGTTRETWPDKTAATFPKLLVG